MIDVTRSCHGTCSRWQIAVTATRFWMCEGKVIGPTRSCHGTRSLWQIAVTATRFWMCEGKVIGPTRSCLGFFPAARWLSPPLNLNSSVLSNRRLWDPWNPSLSAVPVVGTVENFVKDATGESRASQGALSALEPRSLWPLAAAVSFWMHPTAVLTKSLMSDEKRVRNTATCTDTEIFR